MKRVLVTGGSRGLGLALVSSLAQDGWTVLTVSRQTSAGLEAARSAFPGQVHTCFADLSQPGAIDQVSAELKLKDGLAGFVANAAIGTEGALTLTPRRDIETCVNLNLLSVLLLTREVLKPMLLTGGSLVFISSVAAVRGFSGLSVYSATKGALLAFSRSLAREYGPRGIRSNCVLPGFLETEMTRSLAPVDRARIQKRTPLGRLGDVSDILSTVAHLLSEDARFVTGTEIIVDGGLTA